MGEVSFVWLEQMVEFFFFVFHSAGVWSAGLERIFGIPDDLGRKGKNAINDLDED